MGNLLKRLATWGAAALAILAGPAGAQEEVTNPGDPWVHAGTGTPFPAQVAGFQRGRIIEYSRDGRDASVGYSIARGTARLTVTLYIYPVIEGFDCGETFEDAKASIGRHDGSWLVGQRRVASPGGSAGDNDAYFARYSIPAGRLAANAPEVWSDLYLYCPPGDEWLVKYRASWDANAAPGFPDDIDRLLHAVEWPDAIDG